MMSRLWVVLFVALTGTDCGYGLPVRPTPQDYPHDERMALEGWGAGGVYAAVPALALVVTAAVLIFGCTWCYRHKDSKLFTASAQHLHTAQRIHPPDSGFSEPANNNISEDNNNGPISLREMQNIANNNAAAYIISENEERNRISRESVVEFEPLPTGLIATDPLEHCADWFGVDDFPRNNLQYLREIGRGWFGRVVEGEIEEAGSNTTVAVKILNQNATLEDKARFLDEAKVYRDVSHEHILAFIGKCIQEDPWILIFELCSMDLQQYLIENRPKMAILNESGVPLQLMCDVTSALSYLHSRGYTFGQLCSSRVSIRGSGDNVRGALGHYCDTEPTHESRAPELHRAPYTTSSEVWSLGSLIWEVCSWGSVPSSRPSPPPDLPCPYKSHLYQVMQLCWQAEPAGRPTAGQVHALLSHLHCTHQSERASSPGDRAADFEDRWQRLKPNTIPKLDEHVAIVHAPSTSLASHFTEDYDNNTLSVDMDTAVSRSSSIMSDRDPLSAQIKSESLTNLHGSLEDVRNIYLTHNETPAVDCHQGNILEEREKEQDRSDASMDPWLKDIIAGSQDDVSYYKDVSDVIKNLDNILNSEKTSSSESSHQASPSRDNLSLDCKKEFPVQSSLVKSPGITNFQNFLDAGFATEEDGQTAADEEVDRDTIGTLSHSFERHSDTTSQHTLENLTPDTPMKDLDFVIDIEHEIPTDNIEVEDQITSVDVPKAERQPSDVKVPEIESLIAVPDVNEIESCSEHPTQPPEVEKIIEKTVEEDESEELDTELPKEVVNSDIPKLKELCVASMPSASENERSLRRKDCQTSCDTDKRTDNENAKSIDDVRDVTADGEPLGTEVNEPGGDCQLIDKEIILPASVDEVTSSNEVDTLPSVTDVSTTQDIDTSHVRLDDVAPDSLDSEHNYSKDETILVSDLVDTTTDSSKDEQHLVKFEVEVDIEHITPEPVQTKTDETRPTSFKKTENVGEAVERTNLPPEIVQSTDKITPVPETESVECKKAVEANDENLDCKSCGAENAPRSDSYVVDTDDSTVYMDLINTSSQIIKDSTLGDSGRKVDVNVDSKMSQMLEHTALSGEESTAYLDLPGYDVIQQTDDFLQMEKMMNKHVSDNVVASTPIASDNSADNLDNITVENVQLEETVTAEVKVPESAGTATNETKLVQKPSDTMSPFESPSHRSHHTDTYDENSSVVLGPFESTMELTRTPKSSIDPVELPREELLAFSSNFSEMNLETPSPLRDGNFLNEVPDIVPDDLQFDDIVSVSEPKAEGEAPSDDTEDTGSGTQKRVSPSTPPNSPGVCLASTSQKKYIVDIDLNSDSAPEPDSSSPRSIDLNQIELQITSKLAMAENENNLNIEYSGPLTVEGLIEGGGAMRESDAVPEAYLAGNCGSVEDIREELSLDEECVKALRNELELKLPLAQVAAIEPQCEGDGDWQVELPPPPELVVSYPSPLSPIQEETGQQLSAYENDTNWNPPTRTDSSESYPEPCNNSTEASELPCRDTYTVPSLEHTYTLQRPDQRLTNTDLTMSADSLNPSPRKVATDQDYASPINDKTYNKEDEWESSCEHISQVSPFLVSPGTDTSDTGEMATRVSTVSKTTLPTDAKHSKPSETQCLSKATSIDSWCSNDTLYNVEENFDDLGMDAEVPLEYEERTRDGNSDSSGTLTHDEEDKDASLCSTYIIHDSKSEPCETFSPDSITANDNYTYTKARTDAAATAPSATDIIDSKNSQTGDLAYETFTSSVPILTNCTAELGSRLGNAWRLPQPELVRRSPHIGDVPSSPKRAEIAECPDDSSPRLAAEPSVQRMDSVDISCLHDEPSEAGRGDVAAEDSPNAYRGMMLSVSSTPLAEQPAEPEVAEVPLHLPAADLLPSFLSFQLSAEVRPQDISKAAELPSSLESEALLDGDSKTLSRNSNRDSMLVSERSPTYSEFESSAVNRTQDSGRSETGTVSLEEFRQWESSVLSRPQDLSLHLAATSLLLRTERAAASPPPSAPPVTNLIESHILLDTREPPSAFLINLDEEDETEQPHSIIVTEVQTNDCTRTSPNLTYDLSAADGDPAHDPHGSERFDEKRAVPRKHNGDVGVHPDSLIDINPKSLIVEARTITDRIETIEDPDRTETVQSNDIGNHKEESPKRMLNGSTDLPRVVVPKEVQVNGGSEKFATVNFLNETFEELIESSVDDGDSKDDKLIIDEESSTLDAPTEVTSELLEKVASPVAAPPDESSPRSSGSQEVTANGLTEPEARLSTVTEHFLQNEKKYATLDSYFPLLSDIRFTGPASDMMSTSFQESLTSPTSPECEQDSKPTTAAEILKEWDSDSDSHSSNSSSGEFIWKDGAGHETSVVPTTHFDHQRGNGCPAPQGGGPERWGASDGSGDSGSGSGSEGDEVEFVPSSWDCRAAPAKSSLRSLEQATPESKKRVVFKRQKYHCVYEYPRETHLAHSPACLPDLSTYCEWDPSSAEEAELCYGQLFSSPSALGAGYPLRSGISFGSDYDEDFFISSSARPFESVGIMSTTSQFFPGGMQAKRSLLERDLPDDMDDFPPPPSPLATPTTTLVQSRTPSLDFTTPDSGVEDITPSSTIDDDFKARSAELTWRAIDSGSSSESVSPSSPGGEALGGLRHTRDKLKLDLPPSPHVPSPRHARVFNFVLDKPKRRSDGPPSPLVMSDDTPVAAALPVSQEEPPPPPEPTFSTFGKSAPKAEPEQKIVLDEVGDPDESPKLAEPVKGEGTVLDSGDEDSGIESSSKATLERNAPNVS